MPCGKKTPIKRGFGAAGVCASAVAAGTMASRSGNANVTPAPWRKVRRGMCFLVINILIALLFIFIPIFILNAGFLQLQIHLKRLALDDAKNQRRKMIAIAGGIPRNGPNQGHVTIFNSAPQSVCQKFFRNDLDELIGIADEPLAHTSGTLDLRAVVDGLR